MPRVVLKISPVEFTIVDDEDPQSTTIIRRDEHTVYKIYESMYNNDEISVCESPMACKDFRPTIRRLYDIWLNDYPYIRARRIPLED